MKNPNGYGCIKKLSGQRRRPYVFVVTKKGKQIPVSYFATRTEALIYQADYAKVHKLRPLSSEKHMTFRELFFRWLPVHQEHSAPSPSAVCGYRNAFRHCEVLHDKPIHKIKYPHVQAVIDTMRRSGLSYSSAKKVRSLLTLLFRHAKRMGWCGESFEKLIHLGRNTPVRPHKPFTRQKINRLWAAQSTPYADTVLILLYTGLRIGELLHIKTSDVNRRQKVIYVRQSKTAAGIRQIPIHPRIWPLIEERLAAALEYLVENSNGGPLSYAQYMTAWRQVMKKIRGEKHTPHDCRHTFATLLDNEDVNEAAKKRLLGHAGKDVTERVYTHKALRQLRKVIEVLQ